MSASGLCKVFDENCREFDEAREVCRVFMQKYVLGAEAKRCITEEKY